MFGIMFALVLFKAGLRREWWRNPLINSNQRDKRTKMSLKFTITEEANRLHTHRITDLCDYLTAKVLDPFCARQGVRWDCRFKEFFTHQRDCDPFEPTGTIVFYPPLMFAGQIGEMESEIKQELNRLGIKTAAFEYDCVPGTQTAKEIRIPILQNPTAQSGPPEVNLSRSTGNIVLRDLLGIPASNGSYVFSAEDVLNKVPTITDQQIETVTAAPMVDPAVKKIKKTANPITLKSIRRSLEELAQFARWATRHNYHHLQAC